MAGKQVVPAEEHAAKIAAARDAIGDADLFLVARTDARSVNGLQDAIARANLYYEVRSDIHRKTCEILLRSVLKSLMKTPICLLFQFSGWSRWSVCGITI